MYEVTVPTKKPSKAQINAALTRLTGHHLAKGAPGAERARARKEIRRLTDELDAARDALRVQGKPVPPKRKGPGFPKDYDQVARDIITAVRPYTMTSNEKLFALISSVRYIVRNKVPGDIVECGVWRGGSMQAAARTLTSVGDHSRDLYLFDTFEGMPPPSEHDVRADGETAAHLLATKGRDTNVWAVAGLDDVKAGFAKVDYPGDRVHYVQGKVEDTVPAQMPEQISILRLDTDWYESTAHELLHMYDKLSPGGVLMLDDYGHWAGSRKATDEFIDRTGEPLLLLRMAEGRIAVKPWR